MSKRFLEMFLVKDSQWKHGNYLFRYCDGSEVKRQFGTLRKIYILFQNFRFLYKMFIQQMSQQNGTQFHGLSFISVRKLFRYTINSYIFLKFRTPLPEEKKKTQDQWILSEFSAIQGIKKVISGSLHNRFNNLYNFLNIFGGKETKSFEDKILIETWTNLLQNWK